jgi:hypothetical protein
MADQSSDSSSTSYVYSYHKHAPKHIKIHTQDSNTVKSNCNDDKATFDIQAMADQALDVATTTVNDAWTTVKADAVWVKDELVTGEQWIAQQASNAVSSLTINTTEDDDNCEDADDESSSADDSSSSADASSVADDSSSVADSSSVTDSSSSADSSSVADSSAATDSSVATDSSAVYSAAADSSSVTDSSAADSSSADSSAADSSSADSSSSAESSDVDSAAEDLSSYCNVSSFNHQPLASAQAVSYSGFEKATMDTVTPVKTSSDVTIDVGEEDSEDYSDNEQQQ